MKTEDYKFFRDLVIVTSIGSPDTSTKCGAVIATRKSKSIVGLGFNTFPAGVENTPERNERPLKYKYMEHAERNAIYACAKYGISTKDCVMYITGTPCMECARAIVQSGIYKVVVFIGNHQSEEFRARWKEDCDAAIDLLNEGGVSYIEISCKELDK